MICACESDFASSVRSARSLSSSWCAGPCTPSVSPRRATPSKPLILLVAGDENERGRLVAAVERRFGADYRVISEASPQTALACLAERTAGDETAVVVASQQLAGMTGVEFLGRAHALAPAAKRGLLLRYGDPDTNRVLVDASTFGRIDQWEWQPWEPAEERLYPFLGSLLTAWARGRLIPRFEALRVVGERWSARSHELRDLLQRNGIPAGFYDAASPEGAEVLAAARRDGSRLPVAVFHDGRVLVEPSNVDVARALGVRTHAEQTSCDLAVVGTGPAGLAAAVSAASEGLTTMMLEAEAFGGQAGTSSLIRNYLGFPRGIGGEELARLASEQATQFGATFVYARVIGLRPGADRHVLVPSEGNVIETRAVVLATGVRYRRLDVPGTEALIGAGVFYGAATTEAQALRGQAVFVAGAANSAGQAALHLARYASVVTILVRGPSLAAKMSDYLVREIEHAPNIAVRTHTEVVGAAGSGRLEHLTLRSSEDSTQDVVDAAGLFVLIGAEPQTDWLPASVARDERGYVLTGPDLPDADPARPPSLNAPRGPLAHETSVPGVFAAGDVRHGSVKRVASAVGEGAVTVQQVHRYLAELRTAEHA